MKSKAEIEATVAGYNFSNAARGWSFNPERVGEGYRADYIAHLENAQEKIYAAAGPGREDEAEKVYERYEAGYRRVYLAAMVAESNTLSTMIAGPSNFNVRRADKANASCRNRWADVEKYRERLGKWVRAFNPHSNGIKVGASDAESEMMKKIEELEANQERYKAVNSIVRSKASAEVKVERLMNECNCKEETARALLVPDRVHGCGVPSYVLTNNNANIRRCKERLTAIRAESARRASAEESGSGSYELNGIRVEEDASDDRIRLIWPGKPSDDQRTMLKRAGWRWSPTNQAWQRQLTPNARYAARQFAEAQA